MRARVALVVAARMAAFCIAPSAPTSRALQSPPRLAIGCGRRAALVTRLLRERGSKVVQVLDPRIDPRYWDLVVAPEHDGLRGENVIMMLGSLHPVDDLWLAEGRRDFPRSRCCRGRAWRC